MNIFKAGDKVICIKGKESLQIKTGKIYTVYHFDPNHYQEMHGIALQELRKGNYFAYYRVDRFTLATETARVLYGVKVD